MLFPCVIEVFGQSIWMGHRRISWFVLLYLSKMWTSYSRVPQQGKSAEMSLPNIDFNLLASACIWFSLSPGHKKLTLVTGTNWLWHICCFSLLAPEQVLVCGCWWWEGNVYLKEEMLELEVSRRDMECPFSFWAAKEQMNHRTGCTVYISSFRTGLSQPLRVLEDLNNAQRK